jgi:hypothetical protein
MGWNALHCYTLKTHLLNIYRVEIVMPRSQHNPQNRSWVGLCGLFNLPYGAPKRKLTWWGRVLAMTVAAGLLGTGCERLWDSTPTEVSSVSSDGVQFVRRTMGGRALVSRLDPIQLRLNRGWQAAPQGVLHDSAELSAFNPGQSIYLITVGESRDVVGPGSLENQAQVYLDLLKRGFDQVTSSEERTAVTNVNGFPAVQYRVQGEVLGENVAYLHTTIELGGQYYQVVVWTPADRYYENAAAMEDIVMQFGEA